MRIPNAAQTLDWLSLYAVGITTCCLQLMLIVNPGESLYFAQPEWRVTVPTNFPVQSFLARIVVVRGALEKENSTWEFEIVSSAPSNPGIEVSPTSGEVYLTAPLTNLTSGLSVTLTVAAKSEGSHPISTLVYIDIVSLSTTLDAWCSSHAAEVGCLLPSGAHFRLFENDPPQLIGCLGFLGYDSLCPNNAVRYWIQADDSNVLSMNDKTGEIWTRRSFDRESTKTFPFEYGCNVTIAGNVTRYVRQGTIDIEDVNDNGPVLVNGGEFELYLDQEVHLDKPLNFGSQILLKDKDLRSDYSVEIMGDTSDFFDVVISEVIFRPALNEVIRKADIILRKPLAFQGESYRVTLIFKDVTLLPGNGDNQASVTIVIHNKTTTSPVFQQYDVSVFSNARKYAQVLGPFHKHLGKPTEIKFSLDVDSKEAKGVFNVTPTQGIIYVQNPIRLQALSPGPLGLRLNWSFPANPTLNSTWINVTIVPEPDAGAENTTACEYVASCAANKDPESCTRSCGPGTPRGFCQTKGESVHSTCVSNLKTCPDGHCDELELLDWNLCPQDCAAEEEWSERLGTTPPMKANISSIRIKASNRISNCVKPKQAYYEEKLKFERKEHEMRMRVLVAEEELYKKIIQLLKYSEMLFKN